jgi:hypothetical protein
MERRADPVELLHERLRLVQTLSGVNAEALKCNQLIGGLQMELQRIELAAERAEAGEGSADDVPMEETAAAWRAAELALADAEAALADCHRRIAEIEDAVAGVDRALADLR